jgi:altronate hydrolase
MDKIVRLRAEDNVVVANRALEAGHDIVGIVLRDAIPAGHKIASCDIPWARAF